MKKILITGGCGFIGSNFIRYMLKKDPDIRITNLDALTYAGDLRNLEDIDKSERYQFCHGNICDRDRVREAMSGAAEVIHFAAESHVDRSIKGPDIFIQTNVTGTQVLLETARDLDVQKFVHISTDEVYGSIAPDGKFTERSPLDPSSPYSASKAAGDLLVRAYYKTYDFPGVIVRGTNVYGPRQYKEKFLPLMITNALHHKALPIYGDGRNIRDWMYVDDLCAAVNAVRQKGRAGEVYNAGADNEWTNLDLVRFILKKLDRPETLIRHVDDRLGHDRRYATDAAKIKQECGWAPVTEFEQGLERTIKWYRGDG